MVSTISFRCSSFSDGDCQNFAKSARNLVFASLLWLASLLATSKGNALRSSGSSTLSFLLGYDRHTRSSKKAVAANETICLLLVFNLYRVMVALYSFQKKQFFANIYYLRCKDNY